MTESWLGTLGGYTNHRCVKLPEPEFYIRDQILGDGYVIGRENPKPDCPGIGRQCCGLYTYAQVQELLNSVNPAA